MPSEKIGREKVGEVVAARIRDRIIAGEFVEGEPLRLVALSERLGVSTTPIREALAILERQGLVNGETNRGFTVAKLSSRDISDVYRLAGFIQKILAERAASLLSDHDLDGLDLLDAQMREATAAGDTRLASDNNHRIHRAIGLAADSPLLVRFLRETTPFTVRRNDPNLPGWADQRMEGHGVILRALRMRDGVLAGELMESHLLASGAIAAGHANSAEGDLQSITNAEPAR